jgi:hypothetical protein
MITYSVPVPVVTLLKWARAIEDEVGLDGVVDAIRASAKAPDGDLSLIVDRVRRRMYDPTCSCRLGHLCPHHEGWSDALDALEDELP